MANNVYGTAASELLNGTSGDDYFLGGGGNDTMVGGAGNDTYVVYTAGAVVVEAAGGGTDQIVSYVNMDLSANPNVENVQLVGTSAANSIIGNSLNNILSNLTSNNSTLTGGAGNDTLSGNVGNDILDGGTGNDCLIGGAGNDTYYVDSLSDVVVETANGGTDTIIASAAGIVRSNFANVENWQFTGNGGFSFVGTPGNDTFTGGDGKDSISGLAGNDTFDGGSGDDTIDGGAGNDSLTGGAGNDSIIGGTGNDVIDAGDGNDSIDGGSGNDTILAGTGNDTIDGGAGADSVAGGEGNDIYYVDDAGDGVIELASEGNDTVYAGVDFALSGNVENLVLTGSGNSRGTGNDLANVLTGNGGNNVLDGGAGADTMIGGAGNDTYYVDSLGDVITELAGVGGGIDTVFYDAFTLGNLDAFFIGINVENPIQVGPLVGTPGADLMNGDLVFANFNDKISGLGGNDTLNGLGGNDSIDGGAGDDVLDGGSGSDTLLGDTGNDTLFGGDGNDCLDGGAGQDRLVGGAGFNTLAGGTGNDTYVIDVTAAGNQVVENSGEGTDRIEVNGSFSIADPANPPIGNVAPGPFANVEELVYFGAAGVTLTGNSLANYIQSGSGNDCLVGGAGADTMVGGTGNDTYVIDSSGILNDVIVELGGGGIDQVNSNQDVILDPTSEIENILLTGSLASSASGTNSNNVITGNSDDNALRGLAGNDTLYGMAGNDLLDGGLGADCLIGGAGNDTYILDAIANADGSIRTPDVLFENAGEGTDEIRVAASVDLTTLTNFENVTLLDPNSDNTTGPLSSGDFDVIGNASANKITGNAGNNYLDGMAGADILIGGAGNDSYVVENSGDVVTENPGGGTDYVISHLDSYSLPENVENLEVRGGAGSTGTGNATANLIIGNGQDNVLRGLDGADTLIGGLGNDCLDGGFDRRALFQTSDSMIGGGGNDTYAVDNYQDSVIETTGAAGGRDTIVLYPTLLSIDSKYDEDGLLTGTTFSINNSSFSTSATSGTQVQFYLNKLQSGDLNYDPVASVPDGILAGPSQFLSDGNYFYALPANVENLITQSKAITVNGGQFLIAPTYVYGNADGNFITATSDLSVANDLPFDNYIDGQGGNDTMVGGLGNDTYVVDSIGDRILENSQEGTDLVNASVTYDLSLNDSTNDLTGGVLSNVENLTLLEFQETIVNGRPVLTPLASLNFDGYGNGANNFITGNSGNNLLSGGAGNDILSGGAGADTLIGGTGNDCLDGGTGVDSMVGGDGNDTYLVDVLGETIVELSGAGSGTDVVRSAIDFSLAPYANIENLTLTGAAVIGTGNALGNVITGNAVANLLDGGAGVDTMIGGAGDDTYVVDSAMDVVVENAGAGIDEVQASVNYSLTSSANIENLTLLGAAVNGTGNSGNNLIVGNAGNNILDGGGGVDTLQGGVGDDTYVVADSSSIISELSGEGTDVVLSSASTYTLSDEIENLFLGSGAFNSTLNGGLGGFSDTAALNGIGNSSDNIIVGNAGNNLLDGAGGLNTLVGGLGNDTYVVRSEDETITELAGSGTDRVIAYSNYTLSTNLEELELQTGAGNLSGWGNNDNNVLLGNEGNNRLFGYAGNDSIDGGTGIDTMVGGLGNDTYVVDNIADIVSESFELGSKDLVQSSISYTISNVNVENLTLTGIAAFGTGNAGDNVITGNGSDNTLTGMGGNDTIFGMGGNDTLEAGGSGNNSLSGGAGNDSLLAGTGNDTLLGDAGNDTLDGGNGNNFLSGGAGDDSLFAGTGNDTLLGGDGNDTLNGGIGVDSLVGGNGNDLYSVDNSSDVVVESPGGGTDSIISSVTFAMGANIENLTLTGTTTGTVADTDAINGTGNSVGNAITGNAGSNVLDGGGGRDTLDGGLGDDTLLGGALEDELTGGGGNDSLDGGTGNDILLGTTSVLAGADELDTLTGGTGFDVLVLGDSTAAYYNTAANGGDYALITDFSATNDLLQLTTLIQAGSNVNGYVVGTNIYGAAGAANSWLYRDANSNSAADAGDNLIAAINATGGSGAGGALTTNDLNSVGLFV